MSVETSTDTHTKKKYMLNKLFDLFICRWSLICVSSFSQLLEQEILNNRKKLQMEALAAKQVSIDYTV